MAEESEFWARIVWYTDFYDVPRLICAQVMGGTVVLDSPFVDALDEYAAMYSVTFVPDAHGTVPEQIVEMAKSIKPVGQLPVATTLFDATRRRAVKLPANVGGLQLSPVGGV